MCPHLRAGCGRPASQLMMYAVGDGRAHAPSEDDMVETANQSTEQPRYGGGSNAAHLNERPKRHTSSSQSQEEPVHLWTTSPRVVSVCDSLSSRPHYDTSYKELAFVGRVELFRASLIFAASSSRSLRCALRLPARWGPYLQAGEGSRV